MKTRPAKTELAFGGLIAGFYNTYGERNARGVLRQSGHIPCPNRYVVSRATRNA